jgi:quercetin dioxygenase-like cupin family protein
MSRTCHIRLLLAAVAVAAVSATGVAVFMTWPAGASPGAGVTATIVARGTTTDKVHVEANGATEVVYQRVTIEPGGFTGWHFHPGPVLAVVESGTLTHYDDRCRADTYVTGEAFEEDPGPDHVHMGVNLGGTPVVLDVTYVIPAGGPLRVEAQAPSCATAASEAMAR